jgi:hypothetical protein
MSNEPTENSKAAKAKHEEYLFRRMTGELQHAIQPVIQVDMEPKEAISIVGCLQLSLRHPGNTGPSAVYARRMIAGIIQRLIDFGFPGCAEVARLGNDPAWDAKYDPAHDAKDDEVKT